MTLVPASLLKKERKVLKIFYGENRKMAEAAVKRFIGQDYEVFDGEKLQADDLPTIFRGTSLFDTGKRRILIKNLSENSEAWEKVSEYKGTEHDVAIWEMKLDGRLNGTKLLKSAGIEMEEFKSQATKPLFGLLNMALRDGEAAVRELEKRESEQDPYLLAGLLVSDAIKNLQSSGGRGRERKVLKELADLDRRMKTTSIEPWILVKGFLLEVGNIVL